MARVLLGKYCSKDGILSVKAVSRCSWGWHSILWGRDLLIKGLMWDLGDGQDIRAFRDQWITRGEIRLWGVILWTLLRILRWAH